jgi:hypothetical protein
MVERFEESQQYQESQALWLLDGHTLKTVRLLR